MPTLYEVLGVSGKASTEEIKSAFRRRALEKHPDANVGDPNAEEAFKEINQVYAILSDPVQRRKYDSGELDEREGADHSRKKTKTNPFADFTRRKKRSENTHKRSIRINGADVSYALRVSFMEATNGTTKFVSMTNGKRLKVTVSPGTRDKQVLRLKRQGMAGVGGGTDGDALVEILLDNNDLYTIDGDDIRVDHFVSLKDAVLGARIEAPTVDGPVKVTVPANSNTGTILRLRGKGMRKSDGTRGDQFIRVLVKLPEGRDEALTELVKSWENGDRKPNHQKAAKSS